MDQRHRRLDGVQVHSAKGDVSGQTAMEEEDTGMVSCCHQPSEEEGRLEREREREKELIKCINHTNQQPFSLEKWHTLEWRQQNSQRFIRDPAIIIIII